MRCEVLACFSKLFLRFVKKKKKKKDQQKEEIQKEANLKEHFGRSSVSFLGSNKNKTIYICMQHICYAYMHIHIYQKRLIEIITK